MPKSVTRLHTHGLALALGVLTGPDGTTEAGHLWEPVLRGPSPGTGTPSQAVVSLAPELPLPLPPLSSLGSGRGVEVEIGFSHE